MARLAELIRQGAAPASMVQRAARGDLSLPASELIEILVLLAADRELGGEARRTLAGWDQRSLCEVASSEQTRAEVLRHLVESHANCLPVMEALCSNPSLPLAALAPLARRAGGDLVQAMLRSQRVRGSVKLLDILEQNPASIVVRAQLEELRATAGENGEAGGEMDAETEAAMAQVMAEHASSPEEDEKAFELVAAAPGEQDSLGDLMKRAKSGSGATTDEEKKQLSVLQKIARMTVGERIKLAMRGGREERMILIRDRSRLVSVAVLSSPKVNDSEMETFAAMKNVQEGVLRAIAGNRKNMKLSGVLRALVNNPKTPLDISLRLLPHLLLKDLRGASINKNINETLRKMALRKYRAKTEKKKD